MWYWPYIFSEIYDVRPSATKTEFFPKNHSFKKRFDCQCGSGRISFHWSNLFSLARSIFNGRIHFVAYMVYLPVPHKLIFFRKIPLSKKGFVCQCGSGRIYFNWSNLFSMDKKGFGCQCGSGRIYFHWSNLLDLYKISFHFKTGSFSYNYTILNILVMLTSAYMMSQCIVFYAFLKLCYIPVGIIPHILISV